MIAPANFSFHDGFDNNSQPNFGSRKYTHHFNDEPGEVSDYQKYIHNFKLNDVSVATKLSPFLEFVRDGDLVKVRSVSGLQAVDLNKMVNYDKDGEVYTGVTPLGIAVIENNVAMVNLLLNLGADIDAGETSPEMLALIRMEESRAALDFLLSYKKKHNLKSEISSIF